MPSGSDPSWRVLVALLVYNGEEFVVPCLSSLARLEPGKSRRRRPGSRRRQPHARLERPLP